MPNNSAALLLILRFFPTNKIFSLVEVLLGGWAENQIQYTTVVEQFYYILKTFSSLVTIIKASNTSLYLYEVWGNSARVVYAYNQGIKVKT